MKSAEEIYEIVIKALNEFPILPDKNPSEATKDALARLVYGDNAVHAWQRLFENGNAKGRESRIAREIVGIAIDILENPEKTPQEKMRIRKKALELAEQLALFIQENDFLPADVFTEREMIARNRICNGLIKQASESGDKVIFSADIEMECDELQERDCPEYKDFSTEEAYLVLRGYDQAGGLAERLKIFSDGIKQDINDLDMTKTFRPNAQNAKANQLTVALCRMLLDEIDDPCLNIVTDFVSEIFDTVFDGELTKKWWQRGRDISSQITIKNVPYSTLDTK